MCTTRSFGKSLASNLKGHVSQEKCISLNNQPCHARPTRFNVNSNEALYYPFTISVGKCPGSCKTIDNPYPQVCIPHKVKNECKST